MNSNGAYLLNKIGEEYNPTCSPRQIGKADISSRANTHIVAVEKKTMLGETTFTSIFYSSQCCSRVTACGCMGQESLAMEYYIVQAMILIVNVHYNTPPVSP